MSTDNLHDKSASDGSQHPLEVSGRVFFFVVFEHVSGIQYD